MKTTGRPFTHPPMSGCFRIQALFSFTQFPGTCSLEHAYRLFDAYSRWMDRAEDRTRRVKEPKPASCMMPAPPPQQGFFNAFQRFPSFSPPPTPFPHSLTAEMSISEEEEEEGEKTGTIDISFRSKAIPLPTSPAATCQETERGLSTASIKSRAAPGTCFKKRHRNRRP